MNRKLFELIYLMILRQDIKPDEAYDMLKDYFRLTEIAEREDASRLNPTIKKCDPIDLSKFPLIDDRDLVTTPHIYPYDGITWTGGPYTTTGDPNLLGHTCITTAYTSDDDTLHVTCSDSGAITATCTSANVVSVPTSAVATA